MAPVLPPELWIQIFQYLDPYTLMGSAKRINRQLYHIACTFPQRIHGLEPHIWLKIFEEYELSYTVLSGLMQISKHFYHLLANCRSPEIDRTLFQEPAPKPSDFLLQLEDPEWEGVLHSHPVFHCRDLYESSLYKQPEKTEKKGSKFLFSPTHDGFVCSYRDSENATSPPILKATVRFIGWEREYIRWPRPELELEIDHTDSGRPILVPDILLAYSELLSRPYTGPWPKGGSVPNERDSPSLFSRLRADRYHEYEHVMEVDLHVDKHRLKPGEVPKIEFLASFS